MYSKDRFPRVGFWGPMNSCATASQVTPAPRSIGHHHHCEVFSATHIRQNIPHVSVSRVFPLSCPNAQCHLPCCSALMGPRQDEVRGLQGPFVMGRTLLQPTAQRVLYLVGHPLRPPIVQCLCGTCTRPQWRDMSPDQRLTRERVLAAPIDHLAASPIWQMGGLLHLMLATRQLRAVWCALSRIPLIC